jgi:hypothetical protein
VGNVVTLEGWVPEIGTKLTLAQVIDLAFDYRGNTTVVKVDGTKIEGYIYNRVTEVAEPFIQMYDRDGNGPLRIPYGEIRNILFTGRDMASGQSWEAWVERKRTESSRPRTGHGAADG